MRFAVGVACVGVGTFLFVLALILAPMIPSSEVGGLSQAVGNTDAKVGLTVVVGAIVAAVFGIRYSMKRGRTSAALVSPPAPAAEPQATPAPAPVPQPSAQPAPAPQATPQQAPAQAALPSKETLTCKLCPQTFVLKYTGWLELVNHLREHSKELELVFEDYPDRDYMSDILHTWFIEA